MRFILPEETVLLFEKLKRETVAKALPLVFYSVLKGTDEPTEGLDDGTKIAFELAMHHIRKRERKNARQRRYDITSVISDERMSTSRPFCIAAFQSVPTQLLFADMS